MKIFASKNNSWSNDLYDKLYLFDQEFVRVENTKELLEKTNEKKDISYIFFFHWSDYIDKKIYENYKCISFHTSNLPKGRGGSPLQNQILNETNKTFVNAIETSKNFDSGRIYLREQITLQGSLYDIWLSISNVSYEMIKEIIRNGHNIFPKSQYLHGDNSTVFKRLKNNNIDFEKIENIKKIYDIIRMRDAEKYENSKIEIGNFVLEFSRAKFNKKEIIADVKIKQKK